MSGSAPRFSIVVTAFNERDLIGAAIGSALAQSEADLELIVVDDGSTDGTAGVVSEFAGDPRLHLLRQENRGLSAARNAGIAQSRADLVSFLDSDDLLLPEYLERMAATLSTRPEAGFAYTDAWALDDASGRFGRAGAMSWNEPPADPPADPIAFMRLLMRSNFIFVSATVRREALEAVGGFDETLTACEDYDLWLRILAGGRGAARLAGRPAIKRERAGAMTTDHRNMFQNLRRVCDSVADRSEVDAEVRSIAEQRSARLSKELAVLDGEAGTWRSVLARAKDLARRAREPLRRHRAWHRTTPDEIQAAFPGGEWRRGGRTG